ncbi:DMT family transporter, partial [Enterobacter cloacae]|uniref:DMT family transporter n=1 Tax=Enterobacter cloacae TaxID=550 RepID=UPI0021D0FDEF|nr:DMT family transporter [Enterobacter cloacae]
MIYDEKYISAGLASIIFANIPVGVLLVSGILLNEKISGRQLAGYCAAYYRFDDACVDLCVEYKK